jgi:DNA-binding MarR family transcriptional regulator
MTTDEPTGIAMDADLNVGRLGENIGFLAARFSYFAAKIARDALSPLDLSTRLYSVLELASTGSGMSQREIGRTLCLDPSNVLRLVDQLDERGLVERVRDAGDRRVTIIRATVPGRDLAATAADALADGYATVLDELTPTERVDATRLLARLGRRAETAVVPA